MFQNIIVHELFFENMVSVRQIRSLSRAYFFLKSILLEYISDVLIVLY